MLGVPRVRLSHAAIRGLLGLGLLAPWQRRRLPGGGQRRRESFAYVCKDCGHKSRWGKLQRFIKCTRCGGKMWPVNG
jgi:DNA-directed RNA polymerase subunit RPC12/RpoP